MLLPHLYNIAELCAQHGISHIVISPGSRSAPLTIAFARHPAISTKIIPDERAAGFIALGMAQTLKETVVLLCTSGSAVLNYGPAIAEAFYQEVPLLILSADRPVEWVDQRDGQTIRQRHVFEGHVKASFELPADTTHSDAQWHINRIMNEALLLTTTGCLQPVHVNIPIREPFYPENHEQITFDKEVRTIRMMPTKPQLSTETIQELSNIWQQSSKKLWVIGQQRKSSIFSEALENFFLSQRVPVVADAIANIEDYAGKISHHDLLLSDNPLAYELQPDLLITVGKSVLSKSLKQFLRKHPPRYHWHIQPEGLPADTFQSLTHIIPVSLETFLEAWTSLEELKNFPNTLEYFSSWQQQNHKARAFLENYFKYDQEPFTEFEAIVAVSRVLPVASWLHVANSMPVRYINYLNIIPEVFANRGTSGIDGSNSTALGAALVTDRIVTLITGDMAFFYDRNAFWHTHLPPNLRIIVLNNHGGGIFRLLPEPSGQPELKTYFETEQRLEAVHLAQEHDFEYNKVTNYTELTSALDGFFDSSNSPKILEIVTDSMANTNFFRQFKNDWRQQL